MIDAQTSGSQPKSSWQFIFNVVNFIGLNWI